MDVVILVNYKNTLIDGASITLIIFRFERFPLNSEDLDPSIAVEDIDPTIENDDIEGMLDVDSTFLPAQHAWARKQKRSPF